MKLLAELVARILIIIKRGEIEKKGKEKKRKAGGVANVATAQRAAQYMLTRDNLDVEFYCSIQQFRVFYIGETIRDTACRVLVLVVPSLPT